MPLPKMTGSIPDPIKHFGEWSFISLEAALVGANLRMAREAVCRINLAASLIKEGLTGTKTLAPADPSFPEVTSQLCSY